MPATLDAAALCKMADRGRSRAGCSTAAGVRQRDQPRRGEDEGHYIRSRGDPDILLAPTSRPATWMAKMLSFLANADSAALVLGARVPVILTSRADSVRSRIASCAVAVLAGPRQAEVTALAGARSHGRLRTGVQRRLVEPQVLRLPPPVEEIWRLDARGQIDGIGTSPRLSPRTTQARCWLTSHSAPTVRDGRRQLSVLAGWLRKQLRRHTRSGVGHRVVHGGAKYAGPWSSRKTCSKDLRTLEPLAPLHQPHNLAAIEAVWEHCRRAAGGVL
jgi:hypothetical protein